MGDGIKRKGNEMAEFFDPMGDLLAEQAQVDVLVQDFSEEDWNKMAAYCTTWKLKDVIAHIAFFDYCAAELLNGRGESVNAVADAFSDQDEHYHVLKCQDMTGAEILSWWREQRTIMNEAYNVNGLTFDPEVPMYLELTLPSGEVWAKGDPASPNYIKGSARDWALVAIRRRNWMDTDLEVVGDEARTYASIVQTYAGPADPAPEAKNQR